MPDTFLADELAALGLLRAVYPGPVASRGAVPNVTSTANKSAQDMTVHFATDDIVRSKLLFINAYVDGTWGGSTFAEVAPAGTVERQASIEPVIGGQRYQYLFGGSATGVAATGALVETDWLDHPAIRAGDAFRTRNRHTGSANCFAVGGNAAGATLRTVGGEGFELAAATVDKTMTGAINALGAQGSSGYRSPPVAVIGMTRRGTVALFGNSRGRGVADASDGRGLAGAIERSLGV